MPAVADSSTLITLASIGRLSLLREFHGKLLIPPAVWREVVVEGRGRPGASEVKQALEAGWLEVAEPSDRSLVVMLRRELDDGEAEAIALALEKKAEVILLDETDARRIAEVLGIPRAGVVGVLLNQIVEEVVEEIKRILDFALVEKQKGMSQVEATLGAIRQQNRELEETAKAFTGR